MGSSLRPIMDSYYSSQPLEDHRMEVKMGVRFTCCLGGGGLGKGELIGLEINWDFFL